ncbi:ankyrin repeat-containing domain, PGG domain protein [Tanacetum coccineum]|uniref:Ankyrin repeat-containing domain, PGG domain protein n=1 Tax=Tanacetum coccineum TaxID=301880 RepID=A0ABQ4YDS2_9ASTR
MDLLSRGTRDTRDEQIIRSLVQAGAVDTKKESLFGQITHNPKSKLALDLLKYDSKPKFPYRFKQDSKNNEDWLDKKRNTLMVVASLIATMAFQAGTNPQVAYARYLNDHLGIRVYLVDIDGYMWIAAASMV